MAFVQVTRAQGLSREQYDRVIQAAYGDKLADGELFRVAGEGSAGWYVIDGWATREQCDRSGAQLMAAFQKTGVALPAMTVEEFDIHSFLKQ